MTIIDFNTFERLRSQGISDSTIADQMALSNKTFAGYYNKLKNDTGNDPRATTAYLNYRFYGDPNHSAPEPEKQKGYFGRTADRMFERSKEITQSLDDYQTGKQGALNTTAQIGANLFRGAIAPATEGISTVTNKALQVTGLDDNVSNIASDVVNSNFAQGIINSDQGKGVANFMQNNPTGRTIGDIGMAGFEATDVVGASYAANLAKQGVQYGAKQGVQGVKTAASAIRHPLDTIQGFRGAKAGVDALGDTITELTEVGKQAVKQGVDEKVVRFAGEMNPETKLLAQEMTKQAYKGSKELGGTTAHTEIVGQQVLAPLEFSLNVKKEIGKRLGAMKKARYGEMVDVTEEFGLLRNKFDELGIQVGEKGKIVSTGALSNDAKPLMQQLYDFFGDSDGPVIKDFKDIDNFRAKMFDELGSAKGKVNIEQQQIFNRAESLINDMRAALFTRAANGDQALLGLNNLYGKISKPISTFMQRSGIARLNSKLNVDDLNVVDLKAGQFSRRTLGNAAADAKAELNEMIKLAGELGYKSNVNVDKLITYGRALEDLYKIQRPASLGGEFGSALGNGMVGGAAQDLIRGVGVGRTAVNAGTEAAMKLFNKIKGITPDQQTKLLLELFNTSEDASLIQTVKRVLGENIAEKVDDLVPNSTTVGDIIKPVQNSLDDVIPNNTPLNQDIPSQTLDDVMQYADDSVNNSMQKIPNDDALISSLTVRQKKAFDAGTVTEQQAALDSLRFKYAIENNIDYTPKQLPISDANLKKLQKKFPTLTPEEIMNLTPEERATGLLGGGGDNMPRTAKIVDGSGQSFDEFVSKSKNFDKANVQTIDGEIVKSNYFNDEYVLELDDSLFTSSKGEKSMLVNSGDYLPELVLPNKQVEKFKDSLILLKGQNAINGNAIRRFAPDSASKIDDLFSDTSKLTAQNFEKNESSLNKILDEALREAELRKEYAGKIPFKTRSQLKAEWDNIYKATPTTDLVSEARKYGSADKFIEAQGTPVYRGQDHADFTAFDGKEKQRFITGMDGTSFSTTLESAKNYGDNIIEGIVDNKSMLKKTDIDLGTLTEIKAKIKKLTYDDYIDGDGFESVVSDIAKLAKTKGKTSIKLTDFFSKNKIDDEIRVLSKDAFKTKSQLTDIWNQANKK